MYDLYKSFRQQLAYLLQQPLKHLSLVKEFIVLETLSLVLPSFSAK